MTCPEADLLYAEAWIVEKIYSHDMGTEVCCTSALKGQKVINQALLCILIQHLISTARQGHTWI